MSNAFFKLDDKRCLMYSCLVDGHLCVKVVPPDAPDGHVQRWITELDPVRDAVHFGDPGTGGWEVIEDHRKDKLWLGHGKPYTLDADQDGQTYDGLGPVPAWLYAEEPPAPEPTLEEAQAAQLVLINASFEQAAQALTAGYPEAERLTWTIQQSEALAWAADNAVATPYLDGLAAARGITPADMRQLTLAQVQAFQAASQGLVGKRQKLRDQILAAETVATVLAVVW
ncbi:MAG: hypothetical protein KUL86_14080 [Castellaniella sp.]|nr:hypothetical protein [Castellaniella sp.]